MTDQMTADDEEILDELGPVDWIVVDVAVLEGGLTAWTAAGLPTTDHEYAV